MSKGFIVVLIVLILVGVGVYYFKKPTVPPKPKPEDSNQMWMIEEPYSMEYKTPTGIEMKKPVVYDQYIKANTMSRLRKNGDWFRGDLNIEPLKGDWFSPSVIPSVDLQPGILKRY